MAMVATTSITASASQCDCDQSIHHAEHQPVHDILGKQSRIHLLKSCLCENDEVGRPVTAGALRAGSFLSRQLAFSAGVFAVVPFDELAVLNHISCDHRNGVLAVVIESDLADYGVTVLHIGELGGYLLAIWTDLFDAIEYHVHGGISEGAVGLRRAVVFLGVVLLHEELAARQLVGRRAFSESERALGERAEALDEGVRYDAGRAVEHRLNAELIHLRANAHANRRQPAEIDHVRIERLDLRELTGEVLLISGDAKGADDLGFADPGE